MTPLGAKNPKIQQLRRLSGRRAARLEAGRFVIEGPTLVAEAVAAGVEVEEVYVEVGAAAPEVVGSVRVVEVAEGVLGRVLDAVTPQGVAAVAALPTWSAADVLARPGLVVVGDRLGDPGNVGTIIRSLEAFGGAGLLLSAGSADPFQPKVVRSAAGSSFRVPVAGGLAVADIVVACRSAGRRLVITAMAGGVPHTEVDWASPVAVVVGSEAHGVGDELAAAADGVVTIEMAGPTESLNVAMAATVLAAEAARRR